MNLQKFDLQEALEGAKVVHVDNPNDILEMHQWGDGSITLRGKTYYWYKNEEDAAIWLFLLPDIASMPIQRQIHFLEQRIEYIEKKLKIDG